VLTDKNSTASNSTGSTGRRGFPQGSATAAAWYRRRILQSRTKQFMLIESQNWVCHGGPDPATVSTMAAVELEFQAACFRNGLN
jgi:hypothetical protein